MRNALIQKQRKRLEHWDIKPKIEKCFGQLIFHQGESPSPGFVPHSWHTSSLTSPHLGFPSLLNFCSNSFLSYFFLAYSSPFTLYPLSSIRSICTFDISLVLFLLLHLLLRSWVWSPVTLYLSSITLSLTYFPSLTLISLHFSSHSLSIFSFNSTLVFISLHSYYLPSLTLITSAITVFSHFHLFPSKPLIISASIAVTSLLAFPLTSSRCQPPPAPVYPRPPSWTQKIGKGK